MSDISNIHDVSGAGSSSVTNFIRTILLAPLYRDGNVYQRAQHILALSCYMKGSPSQPGREFEHWAASSVKVKNEWSYTSPPPCMAQWR